MFGGDPATGFQPWPEEPSTTDLQVGKLWYVWDVHLFAKPLGNNLLKGAHFTLFFPFLPHFFTPSLMPPIITSSINYFHSNLCLKKCFCKIPIKTSVNCKTFIWSWCFLSFINVKLYMTLDFKITFLLCNLHRTKWKKVRCIVHSKIFPHAFSQFLTT